MICILHAQKALPLSSQQIHMYSILASFPEAEIMSHCFIMQLFIVFRNGSAGDVAFGKGGGCVFLGKRRTAIKMNARFGCRGIEDK